MVAIPQVRTQLGDASLLCIKLLAFVWMVGDHLDVMLLDGALGVHATTGRVVFPLFSLVLAVNLARSEDWHRLLTRTAPRLAAIGLVATPVYAYLMGWQHWNVLFTLAVAVVSIAFVQRGWLLAAIATVLAAGWSVDYGSLGILAVVGCWMLARLGFHPVVLATWAAVAVVPVNGSLWSLLAIPAVLAACALRGDAPRLSWLFWAGYPVHLGVLAICKLAG